MMQILMFDVFFVRYRGLVWRRRVERRGCLASVADTL